MIPGESSLAIQLENQFQSELLNQAILDSSIDAVVSINQAGQILSFNPAATRMFGYEAAEIIGRNVNCLMPEQFAHEHDGYISAYLQTGVKKIIGIGREVVAKRRDGTTFPINLAIAEAKFDDHRIFVASIHDITSRRESEAKIKAQAELLEKVSEAIIVRDERNRITFWNKGAEKLFGWQSNEVLGRCANEFLDDDLDRAAKASAAAEQFGEWRGELSKRSKEGKPINAECYWSRLTNATGDSQGFLILCIDATEKTLLANRNLRAQRLESIGVLAGGIAHDLNNVLTPVLMAIKLLKQPRNESDRLALLETAQASIDRGISILKQLLTFAGGDPGPKKITDVKKIIRESADMLNHLVPKNIKIEVTIEPKLWQVMGDQTQLSQVLVNLCVNARDAMPDGGTMTIDARNITWSKELAKKFPEIKPGPYLCMSVIDTGTGIDKDQINRIFDPFFTTKPFGEGTGLGLSTANGIVRSHSGFMDVYSEPGHGTRMLVYLPAINSMSATDHEAQHADLPRGNGEQILIIDDEPAILMTTQMLLAENGYRVLSASNGADGINTFRANSNAIRAVVIDIMMPDINGPACMQHIRQIDRDVPIIAVSGFSHQDRIAETRRYGADAFVQKPFSDVELLTTISRLLMKR